MAAKKKVPVEIGNYVVKKGFIDRYTQEEHEPGDILALSEERAAEIEAAHSGLIAKVDPPQDAGGEREASKEEPSKEEPSKASE